jgi:two-component system OmpR family response regulator
LIRTPETVAPAGGACASSLVRARLLVVDDNPDVCELLAGALGAHGIACVTAGTAREALEHLGLDRPPIDLILLDIELPGSSGWQFLERVRALGDETPVIFVTATGDVDARIRGLRLGADDYVVKPFDTQELLARAEAVLRRRQASPLLRCSGLRLDHSRRVAVRGAHEIALTPQEFDFLRVLVEARGAVVSRAELLERVWDLRFEPGTALVEVQVARLRRKLERSGPPLIETLVGRGYRIRQPEELGIRRQEDLA